MNARTERPYPWRLIALFAPVALLLVVIAVPDPFRPLIDLAALAGYLVAAALGLFFALRVAEETSRESWPVDPLTARTTWLSIAWGIALGCLATVAVFSASRSSGAVLGRLRPRMTMPVWKRLLLAIHAGISEEIVFRLLMLSALVWVALFIAGQLKAQVSSSRLFWMCNIIVAVAFGFAHLPAWAAVTTITVSLAAAVILVNAVVALALGHVYWRFGIAAAAIAHIVADATLWGVGPSLIS